MPLLIGAVLMAATLAGCIAPPDSNGEGADRVVLSDYTECEFSLEDAKETVVDCRTPLTPAAVGSGVPAGWVCVGANRRTDQAPHRFDVYHHPDQDRVGVRFSTDLDADVYTGWATVRTSSTNRTYNYTTGMGTAFVPFDEPPVETGESFTLEFQLGRVTYESNRTELEQAAKRPTWVPSISGDDRTPRNPYWLIHRFDHGDRSYFFSTLDPVNITYDKRDFRLTITPSYYLFDWEGDAAPQPGTVTGDECSTSEGLKASHWPG